jgi:hypothetical protein
MLIPLTIMKDIDECSYYAVAESINVKGHPILNGAIVDRRDISILIEPPVRVPLQTKEGHHYYNLVSALSALENPSVEANALLFNPEDIDSSSKKEIYGTPCRLKRLDLSPIYRLRVS